MPILKYYKSTIYKFKDVLSFTLEKIYNDFLRLIYKQSMSFEKLQLY